MRRCGLPVFLLFDFKGSLHILDSTFISYMMCKYYFLSHKSSYFDSIFWNIFFNFYEI